MAVPGCFLDACEEIDAAVFSGDAREFEEVREKLRFYVGRWTRALYARTGS